jgi:hypothetical protein
MRAKLNSRTVTALESTERPYDVRDVSLSGFLLRVQPSGRKSWFYQYRTTDGRQTRLKLGDFPALSADGARSIALERAADVVKGVDLVGRKRAAREEGARARQRTLRAFLDGRYEPWAKAHLKSADFQLARLRSDFAEWLDRPMSDLNAFAVEGMRQRWKKDGMQPRSINRDIQRIQSVLSRAVEWRFGTRSGRERSVYGKRERASTRGARLAGKSLCRSARAITWTIFVRSCSSRSTPDCEGGNCSA